MSKILFIFQKYKSYNSFFSDSDLPPCRFTITERVQFHIFISGPPSNRFFLVVGVSVFLGTRQQVRMIHLQ